MPRDFATSLDLFYDYNTSLNFKKWGGAAPTYRRRQQSTDKPNGTGRDGIESLSSSRPQSTKYMGRGSENDRAGPDVMDEYYAHNGEHVHPSKITIRPGSAPARLRPQSGRGRTSKLSSTLNRKFQELQMIVESLSIPMDGPIEEDGEAGEAQEHDNNLALETAKPKIWLTKALTQCKTNWSSLEVRELLQAAMDSADASLPGGINGQTFLQLSRSALTEIDGLGLGGSTSQKPRVRQRHRALSAGLVRGEGAPSSATRRTASAGVIGRPRSATSVKDWALVGQTPWSTVHKASSTDRLFMYQSSRPATAGEPRYLAKFRPQNFTEPRSKRDLFPSYLTLKYKGPKSRRRPKFEFQQHRPQAATLTVYEGHLLANEVFTLELSRGIGDPFGLTVYKDGILFERFSACCEHKYRPKSMLGGVTGSFEVVGCTGNNPCLACLRANRASKSALPATQTQYLNQLDHTELARSPPSPQLTSSQKFIPESQSAPNSDDGANLSEMINTVRENSSPNHSTSSRQHSASVRGMEHPNSSAREREHVREQSKISNHESFDDMWKRMHRREDRARLDSGALSKNTLYAWGVAAQGELTHILEQSVSAEYDAVQAKESTEDMLHRSYKEAMHQAVEYSDSEESYTTEETFTTTTFNTNRGSVAGPSQNQDELSKSAVAAPPAYPFDDPAAAISVNKSIDSPDMSKDQVCEEPQAHITPESADKVVSGNPDMERALMDLRNAVESRLEQEQDTDSNIKPRDENLVDKVSSPVAAKRPTSAATSTGTGTDTFLSDLSSDEEES